MAWSMASSIAGLKGVNQEELGHELCVSDNQRLMYVGAGMAGWNWREGVVLCKIIAPLNRGD